MKFVIFSLGVFKHSLIKHSILNIIKYMSKLPTLFSLQMSFVDDKF
jgi:hypothetical protein